MLQVTWIQTPRWQKFTVPTPRVARRFEHHAVRIMRKANREKAPGLRRLMLHTAAFQPR